MLDRPWYSRAENSTLRTAKYMSVFVPRQLSLNRDARLNFRRRVLWMEAVVDRRHPFATVLPGLEPVERWSIGRASSTSSALCVFETFPIDNTSRPVLAEKRRDAASYLAFEGWHGACSVTYGVEPIQGETR